MLALAILVVLLIFIPGCFYMYYYISLKIMIYKETHRHKNSVDILIDRYLTGEITYSEMLEENKMYLKEQEKISLNKTRKEKLKKLSKK